MIKKNRIIVWIVLSCMILAVLTGCRKTEDIPESMSQEITSIADVVIDKQENKEEAKPEIETESEIADIDITQPLVEGLEEADVEWWAWIHSLSLDELVTRTLNGEFGTDKERINNLGDRYEEVQGAIDEMFNSYVPEDTGYYEDWGYEEPNYDDSQDWQGAEYDNGVYRSYSDGSCSIEVYRQWFADSWCYCAHVQLWDYSRFGSASANGWYGNGTESTFHAGQRLGAILCVNGDYACQAAEPHAVIRKGVAEAYGERNTYVCEAYNANTGMLFNAFEGYCFPGTDIRCSSYTIAQSAAEGMITDTFNFGPAGLNDGYVAGENSGSKRPRTLIGTTGIPGDLWIVVTAGDYSDGVSSGLTFYEGGLLLQSLGCTFGGHLDGGGSSAMYFNGEMLVANEGWEGRYVADFAYVR